MAGETETTSASDGATEPRSPEEIRRDIEATREELGETVEALAAKTDVKAQAKDRVDSAKEQAREKVDELKGKAGDVAGKAQAATPEDVAAQADVVREKARQNPLPFAVGGALVVGFLLGRITAS
jgi:ElaB/YqjD/DUF883 family membrane-anchored ribosome-binding protein